VIRSLSLLDEEVEKEPNRCQALLKGGVGEASRWSEIDRHPTQMRVRTLTQVIHIASQVASRSTFRLDIIPLAKTQKVIETTCVGSEGIGCESEQDFGG